MSDFKKNVLRRTAIFLLSLALSVPILTACSGSTDPKNDMQSDTAPTPMTTEQTAPTEEPVTESYPFSFVLDDGTEMTITLPLDPEWNAELHLCTLSGTETPARVVLHKTGYGTGLLLEEARVFSGDDGAELPVTSVNDILSRYVSLSNESDYWRMLVGGAEYQIPKAQFADYPADQLLTTPDLTKFQNFFVEHGQLFCRVSLLCAGNGIGYAAETLKIRYDIVDGTVTAAEITFERPEMETDEASVQ